MPRLPVDGKKVIEHRITLGAFERKMLDDFATAYKVNRISEPVVQILKDVSAQASIFLLLLYVFPKWAQNDNTSEPLNPGDFEDADGKTDENRLADYLETQNLAALGAGIALTWGTGGGYAAYVGTALAGQAIVEGGEELLDDATQAYNAAKRQARFLSLAWNTGNQLGGRIA